MEIANETWRYRHGVLSVELEELKKLWDRYQYILKLYDKNMGVIKKKRKPRYMDFDY